MWPATSVHDAVLPDGEADRASCPRRTFRVLPPILVASVLLLGFGGLAWLYVGWLPKGDSQRVQENALSAICGAAFGLLSGLVLAWSVRRATVGWHVPNHPGAGKPDEAADRLHQSQLDTLRAEQSAALGQLAARLAHDLRNPLTSMKILVQTAAEAGESASLDGRDLKILDEEMARLERSIQTFLDFARPQNLKEPLAEEAVSQREPG